MRKLLKSRFLMWKALRLTISSFVLLFYVLLNNTNAQWVYMPNETGYVTVYSLVSSGNNIISATQVNGIFLSTNNGTNWTQTLLNRSVLSLIANGSNIFAGTWNYGVYLSTDNGTSWVHTSYEFENVYSLGESGNIIFAGTDVGIYLSTNNGTSWTQTSLTIHTVYSFAVSGNNIFAGTNAGLYISTDNGINWTQTSFNYDVRSVIVNGNVIFAGTIYYGVFLSTNNGTNWIQTSLNNYSVHSLAASGTYIIAGIDNGAYVSSNNGSSWIQRAEGLTYNASVMALCIFNDYMFAGVYQNNSVSGVFRRPLGELTGIKSIPEQIPIQYSLFQNYPNPFNPNTKIKFNIAPPLNLPLSGGDMPALAGSVGVKLIIYDAIGREVAILVNEQLQAGTYEVDWDASNYPSGVYFYKLESQSFSETKKLVLIK